MAELTGQSVLWLKDLPLDAVSQAGGKGTSLANMVRAGLPVPPAFVVCADAFDSFLEMHEGKDFVLRTINGLNVHSEADLNSTAEAIHSFILSKSLPEVLANTIGAAYQQFGIDMPVAVRSSAISEDSEGASFAGQQETYLNQRGIASVLDHVRACWASFFTPRALFYRAQKGSLADTSIAVVVQKMAEADKSGVMFTCDPVHNRRDQMMIEAVYGLGEAVVSGLVTPDNYVIDHESGALINEFISVQTIALISDAVNGGTRQIELPPDKAESRVLSDEELQNLHQMGLNLERYFGKPQDVEWCFEGENLLLLQSRPITTLEG